MLKHLLPRLSVEKIAIIERTAIAELDKGHIESALDEITKLLRAQSRNRDAALALIRIVERGGLPIERGLAVFEQVFRAHRDDTGVAVAIGDATDQVRDLDELNAPPPVSPLFVELAEALRRFLEAEADTPNETSLLSALATTTRMMARQHDKLCESGYRLLRPPLPQPPPRLSSRAPTGSLWRTSVCRSRDDPETR